MSFIHKIGFEIEGEFKLKNKLGLNNMFYNFLALNGEISTDVTVKCYTPGFTSQEFKSKPFKYNKAIKFLKKMEKYSDYYIPNASAGFHIHVSFKGIPYSLLSNRYRRSFLLLLGKTFPEEYNARKYKYNSIKHNYRWRSAPINVDTYLSSMHSHLVRNSSWKNKYRTIEYRIFPSAHPSMLSKFVTFTKKHIDKYLRVNGNDEEKGDLIPKYISLSPYVSFHIDTHKRIKKHIPKAYMKYESSIKNISAPSNGVINSVPF